MGIDAIEFIDRLFDHGVKKVIVQIRTDSAYGKRLIIRKYLGKDCGMYPLEYRYVEKPSEPFKIWYAGRNFLTLDRISNRECLAEKGLLIFTNRKDSWYGNLDSSTDHCYSCNIVLLGVCIR